MEDFSKLYKYITIFPGRKPFFAGQSKKVYKTSPDG